MRAAAHITGGGFHENVPRALPLGLGARVERGSVARARRVRHGAGSGGASDVDMFTTFNMGVGMVLVVDPQDAEQVLATPSAHAAYRIGEVVGGSGAHIA